MTKYDDLDLGRRYILLKICGRRGPNIKAESSILQQLRTLFRAKTQNSNMGLYDKV